MSARLYVILSKICEGCLNKQQEKTFQSLLSKYQCGFQVGKTVNNIFLYHLFNFSLSPIYLFTQMKTFSTLLNEL